MVALGSACSTHIPDERRGGTGELLFSMKMVLFVCAVPGKSFPLLGGLQGRSVLSEGGQRETLELFSELQLFFQPAPKPAFSQIHPSIYCSPCFSLSATSI